RNPDILPTISRLMQPIVDPLSELSHTPTPPFSSLPIEKKNHNEKNFNFNSGRRRFGARSSPLRSIEPFSATSRRNLLLSRVPTREECAIRSLDNSGSLPRLSFGCVRFSHANTFDCSSACDNAEDNRAKNTN